MKISHHGAAMECNEKFLRQMLASPYRNAVGQALLERIENGATVRIIMTDGEQVALAEREAALQVLQEQYNWKPEADTADTRG